MAISDATMLAVHLNGQRWEHQLATLDMDGGNYAVKDSPPYRTWLNLVPIERGQVVTVSCVADVRTTTRE